MNANATSNIYSEQNWEQAAKDGCYDGFFHNAVQEYLVAPTHGYGFQKEMKISYNQIVFNPVSKKDTPCFQTSLLGYIYLLAKEILPYEEDCFHNFFLIDFSESPFTVDSIKHFNLASKNSNVRFIFKDYDLSLLDTFELLINKKEFIDFLQQKHSLNKIQRTNKAISSILSNL